ncbi:RING finger protein unkempt homolog isoform X2 [Lytechinus variegatus]|uniref:RING finger protein unkempt homolog isoform X2 n=1 Tax=Lytechinus variegatus TaxID=7654 RepID=UPI001BB2B7AF|nr:RING finger protein unkempt homolog isoform X2 [Lytechinus variegatus]
MPSEQQKTSANQVVSAQPEKPFHYTYLKEFRTQQCQDFLQHKCPNHRPFTCFHWHFLNQRRRRPIRKRDGTFNYSPDIYCSKYDETSGLCEDRDECPYLHRNTGDTERRYHLRYYKTGTCVHETDARGHCVKNGPHCAFAHGPHDLRQPVYDIREMAQTKAPGQGVPSVLPPECTTLSSDLGSLTANLITTQAPSVAPPAVSTDKDKTMYVDDPRWQDTNFVLANYKTEPCNKPPRLCRQGYACPRYHNARDRRRNPRKFKYRSTPCPNVKIGDEWGDPANCEQIDTCQYCHTRTDQQFHPEIYKSTKCNDMQQTGYCPRGPFCAFAHVDQEMSNTQRELTEDQTSSLSQISPVSSASSTSNPVSNPSLQTELCLDFSFVPPNVHGHIGSGDASNLNSPGSSGLGPIGKPRSNSASSSYSSISETSSYHRSHNAEKDDNSNLFFPTCPPIPLTTSNSTSSFFTSSMSVNAQPFYPTSDTVESVIGNALDELNMDDFDVAAIDKELDNDNSSIGSSTTSLGHLPLGLSLGSSAPVNIPTSSSLNHKSSMPESPASPLSQLPPAFVPQHIQQQQHQQQQIEQAAAAFMSQPNTVPSSLRHIGLGHILGDPIGSASGSPSSTTPLTTSSSNSTSGTRSGGQNHTCGGGEGETDVGRLQEEVNTLRGQVQKWEESWAQAKQAFNESRILKQEIEGLSGGPHLHVLNKVAELTNLPVTKLKQLQSQLKLDLERVEKVLHIRENFTCCLCHDRERSVVVGPCQHLALCSSCATTVSECPVCHIQVNNKTNVVVPAPL